MTPKIGEVYIIDLGYEGKVRPVVVMSREDPDAPRALAIVVPLTSQYSVEHHELTNRRGKFDAAVVKQIRDSIRWGLEL